MIAPRKLESSAIPRGLSHLSTEYDLEVVRRRIMDTDCPEQQNSATTTPTSTTTTTTKTTINCSQNDETILDGQHGHENGLLSVMFDDEDDEYESLPASTTGTHMMAGAIAGVMEHCVMYPVDSVKVSQVYCRGSW